MLHRSRALVALFPLFAFTACDDDPTGPGPDQATVRFANATSAGIDVDNGDATAGTNLGFAGTTGCLYVNTTGQAGTSLEFREAGSATLMVGFSQNFAAGGDYTVIAYPGFTGNAQFMTLDNSGYTAVSGQAGIRVVNAAPGSGSLILRLDGEVVGPAGGVAYGSASAFANVTAGTETFTITSGGTTVATTDALTLTAGGTHTLVVAPPAPGTSELRTFLVRGC